jgi:threonine aldolase
MTTAEFTLPYFKQGDDLSFHLEQSANVGEALERHAESMDAAAKKLRELSEALAGRDVEIDPDTHTIFIHADEDVIGLLVERGLVEVWDDEDDEEDTPATTEGTVRGGWKDGF